MKIILVYQLKCSDVAQGANFVRCFYGTVLMVRALFDGA